MNNGMALDQQPFDVGIVGGGPAGLSAAIVLGRACRRVVLIDHGKPRNAAAIAVHGYLGLDGCSPNDLRARGRREAESYGVEILSYAVIAASPSRVPAHGFELQLAGGSSLLVRKLLLATGVMDEVPEIAGIDDFYGRSVHHCPYCDGWEHRDQRLAALADGDSIRDLATTLLAWSSRVTACTNGAPIPASQRQELSALGIDVRTEHIARLEGQAASLERIVFSDAPPLVCDALFFSAGQRQASRLYESFGCQCNEQGQIITRKKQCADYPGLFIAGDADGDIQFAVVAAAEGAVAATAINDELTEDNRRANSTAPQPISV